MTITFALLAALSNALNVTTQHKASISNPRKVHGWRLIPYLFTSPLWLFGWVALAGAFVFQAIALHAGQLSVVQPLLVTELVFALALRRLWVHQDIRSITWWSAGFTCVSLAVFIAMSEPQGGKSVPSSEAWASAGTATLCTVGVLVLLGMWGSPRRRAALMASATAVLWALVATFIKTTTETFVQFGAAGMFAHWPVYALAVSGLAAAILNQVTLHIGPLSVSQPFLVIVDPIVSIALSVWIFDESFSARIPQLTVASVAFCGMCVAATVLTRTAPSTMEPADASVERVPDNR